MVGPEGPAAGAQTPAAPAAGVTGQQVAAADAQSAAAVSPAASEAAASANGSPAAIPTAPGGIAGGTQQSPGANPPSASQAAQAPAQPGEAVAPALRAMRGERVADGAPVARPAGAPQPAAGTAPAHQAQQAATAGAGTPQAATAAAESQAGQAGIAAAQIVGAAQPGTDAAADMPGEVKVSGSDTVVMRQESPRSDGPAPAQAADRAPPRPDATAIVRLAQQVGQRAGAGETRFEIRMDPPELGRIEVRLHIDRDNRAHAVLLAERADTLSDLSRASRALERALEDAGLKLAQGGLEFGLKRDAPHQGMAEGRQPVERLVAADGDGDGAGGAMSGGRGQSEPDEAVTLYGFRLARPAHIAVRI
jgi:flagellar hook-length control protein FliK